MLWAIAKISNAVVIGITKSKLDDSANDSEIFSKDNSIPRRDRNRKGGGLMCYIS